MDGKGPVKRTMKACIESAGWKRRNGWYPHCKHSVWISQTHLLERTPSPHSRDWKDCLRDRKRIEAENDK